MSLLLDTHTFIWWDSDQSKLSPRVLGLLTASSTVVYLSVVSVWELQIKSQLGKLALRVPVSQLVAEQQANGIQILGVSLAHVLALETLPTPHKDPFDRLLVAQANVEGFEFAAVDTIFAQYPVRVVW
jgi:PIN domain nuclease of toxin-antitoxin system